MQYLILCVMGIGAAGAACLVAGVALLAGVGWALVSCGLLLLAFAQVLRMGLTRNG